MNWIQTFTDNFARSDTAYTTQGSQSNTTIGNGWNDIKGNYRILGGKLTNRDFDYTYVGYSLNAYQPSITAADQRITLTNAAGGASDYNGIYAALLRYDSTKNSFYGVGLTSATATVGYLRVYVIDNSLTAGKQTYLGSATISNFASSKVYTLDCQAVGMNPTVITGTVYESGTAVATVSFSDSTAAMQITSGKFAVTIDNSASASYPDAITGVTFYSGSSTAPLASQTGSTPTTITVGWAANPGATSYPLYGSQVAGFTPAAGNLLYSGAGLTYTHTTGTPPGSVWYYKLNSSDGTTTLAGSAIAATQKLQSVLIAPIGDSITANDGSQSGFLAALALIVPDRTFSIVLDDGSLTGEAGVPHSLAVAGTTSEAWRPDSTSYYYGTTNLFANALRWMAAAGGKCDVPIMLGTNDSKDSVATTPARYAANIAYIAASLVAAGHRPILHSPPYCVPYITPGGTTYSDFSDLSPGRTLAFGATLDALCNGTTIVRGDRKGWAYIAASPSLLQDGIHPGGQGNQAGSGQQLFQALHAYGYAAGAGYIVPMPAAIARKTRFRIGS